MHSSPTRNSIWKGSSIRHIDNVHGWKCIAMPPYYCSYECWLQIAGDYYWYQFDYTIFNVLDLSWEMWKSVEIMGIENIWKYVSINCHLEYR